MFNITYFSIQKKMLSLLFFIGIVFITSFILFTRYDNNKASMLVKNQEKEQKLLFDVALSLKSKNLETMVRDYSLWDEMIRFVHTKDLNWGLDNITPGMQSFNIQCVWVYSPGMSLVFSYNQFNDTSFKELPVIKEKFSDLLKVKWFVHFFSVTSKGLMEFYGGPIQRSNDVYRKSTPQGYFFASRLWSPEYLKSLSVLTSALVEVLPGNSILGNITQQQPYKIIYTQNLKSWDGKILAILKAEKNYEIYQTVAAMGNKQVLIFLIFTISILIVTSLFLLVTVSYPLRQISKCLSAGEPSTITKLTKYKDEFGNISALIIRFFRQKKDLESEVIERKKAENELKKMKDKLEVIVEERTAELAESNRSLEKDISKRREIEMELIYAKEMAEKSDKLKTEFLAQMSHEIRSPISTMLNYISLIKEEVPKPYNDDMEFCVKAVNSSSDRLIRTIDMILNMSQIQTGYLECKYSDLNLETDILKNLLIEFHPLASMKGLSLSLSCESVKSNVYADNYSTNQIFNNLIHNAIKYTKKGAIQIKIYNNHKNNICVDVTDTGIGIADEFQANLFVPFSQEEQGYTRKYDGNGLGLALVKKYCEMNNASISVRSKKGEGSTFTVEFLG